MTAAATDNQPPLDVEATVLALAEALNEISDRVGDLEDTIAGPPPIDLDAELAKWVDWLAVTYGLTDSLTAWEEQAGIVLELKALHAAHVAAYGRRAPANAPLNWHEALVRALPRIDETRGRMRKPGTCQPVSKKIDQEGSSK